MQGGEKWVIGDSKPNLSPKFECKADAMQCNAMQCKAMQCNAMQCNAMQSNAMQCNAMQCNEMQCNAMQCNAMQDDCEVYSSQLPWLFLNFSLIWALTLESFVEIRVMT